ncbi:pilus assembly protein TadG-related protein [Trinickia dinghuensis]|uniref:Pilus assembly protein TadG n=1 Tax=Trinickia dinghuensis TaxID=2291023 RepID=A0A3D8K2G2_9BURK|nr:TadE/TadG family type IV pilus assembly protein [Trinickia dinghuensis]RDU99045.1 pilus assembly protein TadG [Trinickia dinghuensis]
MRSKSRRTQGGAVAVIVALSLAVLIGVVGLALDLGKLYIVRSELQNSADACALAAVRDLTGATINLSISEAAGITAGNLNRVFFQSTPVQLSINSNVTFSDSLTDPFLPKSSVANASAMKFVKCTTSLSNIANWFVQVLNVLPGNSVANASVSTMAVATINPAQTTCAIPVFICEDGTQVSPPVTGLSYTKGQWIASKTGSPPTYGAGNFGWAALDGSNSASSIRNELTGNYCSLPAVGSSVGSPGNKITDTGAWNSRFGIYANPYSQSADTPDFTGFAYNNTTWPAGSNAYSDFVSKRASFTPYQGDAAVGITTSGSSSGTTYSAGADRRLALAPEVDCGQLLSGHKANIAWWDCVLMLDPMDSGGGAPSVHLEYEGKSTDASVPCATEGIPGDGNSVGPLVPVLVQ